MLFVQLTVLFSIIPFAALATSSLLCNSDGLTTNWWCAKDSLIGQAVNSAIKADSCFCVMFKNQTQQAAFDACSRTGGILTDIQNSDENKLIGELIQMSLAQIGNLPSSICPQNSHYFNGSCYSYITSPRRSWLDAENYCKSMYGGHLTSIYSAEQQKYIFQNLTEKAKGCSIYGFWIGGNNYGDPSTWKWSDGTTLDKFPLLTNYSGWAHQPEDPKNQQCMTIVQPDGGWGDWFCYDTQPFVCQFPLLGAWIGLQNTISGHIWNSGVNCEINSATYQSLNPAEESIDKNGYVYGSGGVWKSMYLNATANAAVCRSDRNVCGRNPCGACNSCTPTNGGKCFSCKQFTSSPSLSISSLTAKTIPLNNAFSCGTSASSTSWWCAKDQPQAQMVTSAVTADSCFCIMNKVQNQKQAYDSCISIGGYLTDIQNSDENQMIGKLLDTSLAGTADNRYCPSGASYFDGFCYIYQSALKKTWQDAENYCQNTYYDGHLASVHSSQEQQFLFNNLTKLCANCTIFGYWVGGYNHGDPLNWRWSDGSLMDKTFPLVTAYKGWLPQPDAPTIQQCMTLVQPDGGWGDWYCYIAQPFVCRFPIISAWIGLQKMLSGLYWNIGNTCQLIPARYQNLGISTDMDMKTSYLYRTKGGSWRGSNLNGTASLSICRLDRNFCARNNCPTCNQCRPVNKSFCNNSCVSTIISSFTSSSSSTSHSISSRLGSSMSTTSSLSVSKSTNSTSATSKLSSSRSSNSTARVSTATTTRESLDVPCGQTPIAPNLPFSSSSKLRIINGITAIPHSWPWAVFVFYNRGDGTGFMCGGSLVNPNRVSGKSDVVITAAHCVTNELGVPYKPASISVYLGAHSSPTRIGLDNTVVVIGASKVQVQSGYNTQTKSNDLAIIILAKPVSFNDFIQPICLPLQSQQPANPMNCVAVGWGRISDLNTTTASVLQQVQMPILPDTYCGSSNVYFGSVDLSSGLCAGYINGSKSACQGDSGGPLMCQEGNSWTLYGATSYGGTDMNGQVVCAIPNRPTIYTRISNFINWIQNNSN